MPHRLDKRFGKPRESVGRNSGLDNAKALNPANYRNSARGTTINPNGLNYRNIFRVGQFPDWGGWTKSTSPAPAMGGA